MKTLKFIFLFYFSLNIYAQETLTLTVNLQEDVEDNFISIYKKTGTFPHYEFVIYRFNLEFGFNQMELEFSEGEYLLKSHSLNGTYSGNLNWTITDNLLNGVLIQGTGRVSEFSICYTEDCAFDCEYIWEPVCVSNSTTYGNECLANKDGVYTYTQGVCSNNLYNTAFVGEDFDQSVYLGHDNSEVDNPMLMEAYIQLDWLNTTSNAIYSNDCEINPSFENLNEYGNVVEVCGQGIPTVDDVGEYYFFAGYQDAWSGEYFYLPRRFQVFETNEDLIVGCTDPTAANFNNLANTDYAYCSYPCEDYTIYLHDSWGDGWNGNELILYNNVAEEVYSITLDYGSEDVVQLCIEPGCYNLAVGGGAYLSEVSWEMYNVNNELIYSGEAPYDNYSCFNLQIDSCSSVQTFVAELNSTILPANITLNQGWNMFGYVCYESQDVEQLFEPIEDEIVIVKNNMGLSYLPEWGYNGIGDLNYAEGYQIKVTSQIGSFSLCNNTIIIPE